MPIDIKKKVTKALKFILPTLKQRDKPTPPLEDDMFSETSDNKMHGFSLSKIRQQIDPELLDTIKLVKHKKRLEVHPKKHKNKSSGKPRYAKMIRDKKVT